MLIMNKAFILFFFLFNYLYVLSQNELIDTKIDSTFLKLSNFPEKTQFAIAVIKNSKTEYIGFIVEDKYLKKIDNKDSLFEIGSLTKIFTATLLANSINNNKINLSDRINKNLPFKLNNKLNFTYLSLANHTAGLYKVPSNFLISASKNNNNPYLNYSQEMFFDYLKNDLVINDNINGKYSYSNLGYALLGYSLSLLEKMSYQELIQTKIFNKYEMNNSFTKHSEKITVVNGLDQKGNKTSFWDFNSSLEAAGCIISNTYDLSNFISSQFNENNLDLKTTQIPTFTVNKQLEIGLGWHIIKSEENNKLHWHNGATGGYTSSIAFDVNNKTGIIILSNISAMHPNAKNIDELTFELIKILNN